MKKFIFILLSVCSLTLTSCLKSGLDDLPAFEENDITAVPRMEYRFVSDVVSNASQQNVVKYVNLSITRKDIDKTAKKVTLEATVPAVNTDFSAAERNKVEKTNIVVIVSVSAAAKIIPIGDAPKLGVPGDWSKPNKYKVQAANGSVAEWTIEVANLVK